MSEFHERWYGDDRFFADIFGRNGAGTNRWRESLPELILLRDAFLKEGYPPSKWTTGVDKCEKLGKDYDALVESGVTGKEFKIRKVNVTLSETEGISFVIDKMMHRISEELSEDGRLTRDT